MFQFLNKIIRGNLIKRPLRSESGQIAIILILVIAAMLIYYAASLNFGQLSGIRAFISTASNTSAAILASNMASYGQQLSSTQLGGQQKVCANTGFLAALISLIIVVIAAVLTCWAGCEGVVLALAIISVVLAVGSVVLQAVVIQPGLTNSWNRITSRTLSFRNQITENAIQNALGKAVTDQVNVPDIMDNDLDGLWEEHPPVLPFADTVSRYGVYYAYRLRNTTDVDLSPVEDFIEALEELLNEGIDGWGIHDHLDPSNCFGTAECHPCCRPESFGGISGLTPPECDDGVTNWAIECGNASPYGLNYPWVYDISYENPNNAFLSFREQIGKDDQHQDFYKDNVLSVPPWDPNDIPQNPHFVGEEGFYLEDASGFYLPPHYTPDVPENRRGIHPFFHKLSDWGVDLATVGSDFSAQPKECHWCDQRDGINCIPCAPEGPHPQPAEIPQLVLPLDPAAAATNGLTYNLSYFVDGVGNPFDNPPLVPPNPPLAVDKVIRPTNILADDTVCAENSLYPVPTADGFWKEGGDQFCSPDWPYAVECPKHVGTCADPNDCACGEPGTDPALFPDDSVDGLYYALGDFTDWAENLIADATVDLRSFAADFDTWYPDAARWIEPASPPATASTIPACYLCNLTDPNEGILYVLLQEMTEISNRIVAWLDNAGAGYLGATCTEVWCMPDGGLGCAEVPPEEARTFDVNANGIIGDVEDIASCLNYNVEGVDHVAAAAFENCLAACGAADCTVGAAGTLPEFHTDGITPYDYPVTPLDCVTPPWGPTNEWFDAITLNLAKTTHTKGMLEGNDARFGACGSTCSLGDCHSLPRSMVPTALYDPQAYQPWVSLPLPGAAMDPTTADGNWQDIQAFYTCLDHCNAENCLVGPRLPTVHTADGITPYDYSAAPPFDEATDCVGGVLDAVGPSPWYTVIQGHLATIVPPDEVDIVPMVQCFEDCNAHLTDCQNMPVVHTGDGVTPYVWTNPPAGFLPADCAPLTNKPLAPWDGEIIANVIAAGGPSCDLSPNGWHDQTRQSFIEAQNQVAKFQKRRDYLEGRAAEANNILDIFNEAIGRFTAFLAGPAQDLITERIDFDPNTSSGLPYHAIYGWRDKTPPGEVRGKWHIVKVEARMPGNCDNRCSQSQGSPDPEWPKVITYTKNWGMSRCYELVNTEGSVKFRTARYDEEIQSGLLSFPNAMPIWKSRSAHPDRPQTPAFDPSSLDGKCVNATIKTLPDGTGTTVFDGAFMMKELVDPDNIECWNLSHDLLSRGAVDETCAEYFWDGTRMNLRFVGCAPF